MLATKKENINTWISQINSDYKVAVSVDCVIIGYDEKELKVLLIDCNTPPYEGMKSLLGALVKPEEELDAAAERILFTYTGMRKVFMEQVSSFGSIDRHPLGRVITIAYYSLLQIHDFKLYDLEHKGLQWVKVKDIDQLAFDHNLILNTCIDRLKKTLQQQPIGFNLLPKKFTLNQLQNLYEVVLDINLDKRNFRRKLRDLNLLIDLGESQQYVAHRPARLYSFNKGKYQEMKNTGFKFEV